MWLGMVLMRVNLYLQEKATPSTLNKFHTSHLPGYWADPRSSQSLFLSTAHHSLVKYATTMSGFFFIKEDPKLISTCVKFNQYYTMLVSPITLLLLLSRFSRVRLCATPQTAAHQAPVPAILQARTLEWVAISFSNA